MSSNNNHFESGMMYRLGRLLDSDVKIIIPDLQRDYCWGTTLSDKGVSLAKQFTLDMREQFMSKSKDLSIGLLYGYEVPVGHLQLCDGQQRITTLYLLLGLLNRKTKTLQDRLLSQREMDEFQEPYLQYSIRESTLYFMNDLVSEFFCDEDESIKDVADIHNQSWYFEEYDQDPSIISMMQALTDLEKIINELKGDNPYRFAYFLCNEVKFIYYDMQTRLEGEKTFVIINTKGEPLTPTENLKPIFLEAYKNAKNVSKTWEEWETYFWQHRNEDNGNDTADAGMREFFRWIMLIHYIKQDKDDSEEYNRLRELGIYSFDTNNIKFDVIGTYFNIVKNLFDEKSGLFIDKEDQGLLSPREYDDNGNPNINQNAWYRLLPIMVFMHKFEKSGIDRDVKRIYQFFNHTSNLQNVGKSIKTLLPAAIRSVLGMKSDDILDIDTNQNGTIFTQEEIRKLDLIRNWTTETTATSRDELEDALWDAENYPVWKSTIMPLIDWAYYKNINVFNLCDFKRYHNTVKEVFKLDKDGNLDLFRRLLRKLKAPDYPCHIESFEPKSLTYKSFGYNDNEWREIIEKNSDTIRTLLDSLSPFASNTSQIVNQMQIMLGVITTFDPMVCVPELLANCEKKLVKDGNTIKYKLMRSKRGKFAYRKSFLWYLYVKSQNFSFKNNWRLVDYYWSVNGGCTYFESDNNANSQRLTIDVAWTPDNVRIYLFSRDENKTQSLCQAVANKKHLQWDKDSGRYYVDFYKYSTNQFIFDFVKSLM